MTNTNPITIIAEQLAILAQQIADNDNHVGKYKTTDLTDHPFIVALRSGDYTVRGVNDDEVYRPIKATATVAATVPVKATATGLVALTGDALSDAIYSTLTPRFATPSQIVSALAANGIKTSKGTVYTYMRRLLEERPDQIVGRITPTEAWKLLDRQKASEKPSKGRQKVRVAPSRKPRPKPVKAAGGAYFARCARLCETVLTNDWKQVGDIYAEIADYGWRGSQAMVENALEALVKSGGAMSRRINSTVNYRRA